MIALATPLLMAALGTANGAGNNDWLLADESRSCDMTDVDFSDRMHGFATCAFGDAMTTDNGGLSWSVFGTDLQQSLLFAHAASADELYAARLGFYRSIDGGDTWEELGNLSDNSNGSAFDVYFGKAGHLVAIQGGVLLYSDDGGLEWHVGYPGKFNVFFDELHFPSESVGYASGGITTSQGSSGNVLRTDDAGVTWNLLSFTHGEITAADFFDDAHGVVATFGGELYSTADSGDSWQPIGNLPGVILLDLVHRDQNHWYAVSFQGCVYETRDAGVNWETGYCDPGGNALAAITLHAGPAVAGGNSGVVLFENRILRTGFD